MVLPFGVIAMNCRPPGSKIFLLRNFVEFGIAYRLPSPLSTHVVVAPVTPAGRAAGGPDVLAAATAAVPISAAAATHATVPCARRWRRRLMPGRSALIASGPMGGSPVVARSSRSRRHGPPI